MTTRSTAILLILVLLTLAGFALVSRALVLRLTETGNESRTLRPSPTAPPISGKGTEMAVVLSEQESRLNRIVLAVNTASWSEAKKQFAEFQAQASVLADASAKSGEQALLLQDFSDFARVKLERALSEQNAREAMMALNQLSGILGQHRARTEKGSVLPEFQRLAFLAREVELWSANNDEALLRIRLAALDGSWRNVREVLVTRRVAETALEKFDALLEKLQAARKPREVSVLVPELKKQLEDLVSSLRAEPKENVAEDGQ